MDVREKNELSTVYKILEIGSAQNIIIMNGLIWQCSLAHAHTCIFTLVFKKNMVDIFRIPPPPKKGIFDKNKINGGGGVKTRENLVILNAALSFVYKIFRFIFKSNLENTIYFHGTLTIQFYLYAIGCIFSWALLKAESWHRQSNYK